jgi:hypothetical protein
MPAPNCGESDAEVGKAWSLPFMKQSKKPVLHAHQKENDPKSFKGSSREIDFFLF